VQVETKRATTRRHRPIPRIRESQMLISRAFLIASVALTLQLWNPSHAAAHRASLTSAQLLQRSIRAMRSVHSVHTQSKLHLVGRIASTTTEVITARAATDCTSTRTPTRVTTAIRSVIRGTTVVGKGSPQAINVHYILLESSSLPGGKTRTSLWKRDAAKSNRWRRVQLGTQGSAYAALFNVEEEACPSDTLGLRVAQSSRLRPATTTTNAGHPAWVLSGTSGGPVTGLFSVRIVLNRATYRLDSIALKLVERVKRQVAVQQHIVTSYSRYGSSFAIGAPVAGSRTP
jgi:hypothetical protein